MSLDPPLPIYLFGLVAGLREKNAKGYPVKKVCHPFYTELRQIGLADRINLASIAFMEVFACMSGWQ